MTYISVLDFSTSNNCVIEDEDDIFLNAQTESVEEFLVNRYNLPVPEAYLQVTKNLSKVDDVMTIQIQ